MMTFKEATEATQHMNNLGMTMFKAMIDVKKTWADTVVKDTEDMIKKQNDWLDSMSEGYGGKKDG